MPERPFVAERRDSGADPEQLRRTRVQRQQHEREHRNEHDDDRLGDSLSGGVEPCLNRSESRIRASGPVRRICSGQRARREIISRARTRRVMSF